MVQLERPTAAAAGPPPARPSARAIGQVQPRERVIVTGVVAAGVAMSICGCPACRYTLADETGEVDLLFLGRVAVAGLEAGRPCRAAGMATIRDGRMVIWNPKYLLWPAEQPDAGPADGS